MKKHVIYWLALGLVLLTTGCQKEKSFELGNTPAKGSLQADATGDCLPKTVNGSFIAGAALVPATNTIVLSVNVTQTGVYTIGTDTVNGYFFRGTGRFTSAGMNTVTLQSSGTPFAAGTNNFVVRFDGTICDIQVPVLPVGTTPAVFTLVSGGTPVNCATADTNGIYVKDAPVNATNNVDITVNVTAVGTYTIRATGGGLTFQRTASFSTTGNQIIRLPATGTPTTAGNNTITFDAPFASCSFVITVVNPVSGTLGGAGGACVPIMVNGTYTQGVLLTAGNTVQVQITTSAVGPYNITTDTRAGISFSASGTSTGATQTITLINNGATPSASGPQTFTVTFGSSTCTFVINILPVLGNDYFPRTVNSNWSYEYDDNVDPTDTLLRKVIAATLNLGNTFNIFMEDDGTGFDSSGYYRKNGGDYNEWVNISGLLGFDPPPQWSEYTFLKDNVAAGAPWNSNAVTGTITIPPAPPTPATVRLRFAILQKDVGISFTTSLGAMNFTNVIVVEEKLEQFIGGSWQDVTALFGSGRAYYARGIGLVKQEFFNGGGTLIFLQELRRYNIF